MPHEKELDNRINRIIEEALMEDIGMGDVTTESTVDADTKGTADILIKQSGIVAGLNIAEAVFHTVDSVIEFQTMANDGSWSEQGTNVARITGLLSSILKAERTALNFMQRMSGIATLTRHFVEEIKGTNAKITDTRKTAPGLRILDKLAVELGGGINHRFGLDDMVLIKDNHIAAAGGIRHAIERCITSLRERNIRIKIEVETTSLDQVMEVLRYQGIHRIMLDNFSIEMMREAVKLINHAVEVEASGNVRLENVRRIAETGVDVISVGTLTHSPKALDISLDIQPIA